MTTAEVEWPVGRVRLTWHPEADSIPLPITSAHCFCFRESRLAVVKLEGRGAHIPGGHLEPGESPEGCVRRELLEEACLHVGRLQQIGYIEVDHTDNRDFDIEGVYPRVAAQVIFQGFVARVLPFTGEHEIFARSFVELAEVAKTHAGWNPAIAAAFDRALSQIPDRSDMQ